MPTLQLQGTRGEVQAGEQILPLQIREFGQNLFKGIPAREVFEDGLDRVPETANHRLPVANLGVDGDA